MTVLEATRVSDLEEIARGISRNPITVPLSDIEATADELRLPGRDPLELDTLAVEKLTGFLGLPTKYLLKVSPGLRAANLNYWLNQSGEGLASIYSVGSSLTGISDPNKKTLPLVTYLDSIVRNFDPDDEVVEFHSEPEYLHVDIITDKDITVPGDGSEGRPSVGDITRAGIRVVAYPDVEKPPVVSSYLNRLICTNGMAIPEIASKITLRGKSTEEVNQEFEAIIQGLKIDLDGKLEAYANTANIPVEGEFSHFLYNMSQERGLSRNVTRRVLDLGSNVENPSVYDAIQIFTSVANESVNYNSRINLQTTGGLLAGHTEHMLNRCTNCQHSFVDYNLV